MNDRMADWRVTTLSKIRKLIKLADPEVVEEQKYKMPSNPAGIPVWYHDGMICTGETYKKHLRLSFTKGPSIKDPKGLFNRHSAIVIEEGDKLDQTAFKNLIRAAVALNSESKNKPNKQPGRTKAKK